jgi:hypothetical protein
MKPQRLQRSHIYRFLSTVGHQRGPDHADFMAKSRYQGLLSETSIRSQFVSHEVQYALDKSARGAHGANIIPIMLDDPGVIQGAMPPPLQRLLGTIQSFDFSQGDFDTNITRLVAHLKSRPMD